MTTNISDTRSFAAIICQKCLYLEFPGCDVHGLYTEFLPDGHAKCPSCAATTNNVRPFKDGCRRCKGRSVVKMWCCSIDEISQAFFYFPRGLEEIQHTVLQCEHCSSVLFPSSKKTLTIRTSNELLTTCNQRHLKVSNYQLSMNHVQNCPRVGMPLTTTPVQLSKTEVKFLHERMSMCPVVAPIIKQPQYLSRKFCPPEPDNHLHQVCLRLLSTIIRTYDYGHPDVEKAVTQVSTMFENYAPLSIFEDWSPPREFPEARAAPTRAFASNENNERHTASKVLANSMGFWKSLPSAQNTSNVVHVGIEFECPVIVTSIELKWHEKYVPSKYTVNVSHDGQNYEAVALVTDACLEKRIFLPRKSELTQLKIDMLSAKSSDGCYGLHSLTAFKKKESQFYISAGETLQGMQSWLSNLVSHESATVQEMALKSLQGMALSSGSLSTLLMLVKVLFLASEEKTTPPETTKGVSEDKKPVRTAMHVQFCAQFSACVQSSMSYRDNQTKCSKAGENDPVSVESCANSIPRESSGNTLASNNNPLEDEITREAIHLLRSFPGYNVFSRQGLLAHIPGVRNMENSRGISALPTSVFSPRNGTSNTATSSSVLNPGGNDIAQKESIPKVATPQTPTHTPVSPLLEVLKKEEFINKISSPMQVAIFILVQLGELSVWQMEQMQNGEGCFIESKGGESFPLEEPFSVQVCVQVFELCYSILRDVLGDDIRVPYPSTTTTSLYESLQRETKFFTFGLNQLAVDKHCEMYNISPESIALCVLQVVTCNIRRLVLSRVNPAEVGIEPAISKPEDPDALAPPPSLASLLTILEELISSGCSRSDKLFPLSLQAAAAMEFGMEAIYPSTQQRTKLLTSRMGTGSTLEVQFRWPAEESEQEDPRYERLMLLLQLECNKLKMKYSLIGHWRVFIHLVVKLPEDMNTERVLRQNFAHCIQQAGFSMWQVVAGAQEISITLQRHLHWDRVEKMSHDGGTGWIRVYPRDVAAYEDVVHSVEAFVRTQERKMAQATLENSDHP